MDDGNKQDERSYNGYSLFFDIEDKELRAHNRAACLRNIFDSHSDKEGKVGYAGTRDFVEYLNSVPFQDRPLILKKLRESVNG